MNEKFEIIHKVVNGRLVAVFVPKEEEEVAKTEEDVSNE